MRGKDSKDCAMQQGSAFPQYALKEQGKYEFTINEALMLENYLHMSESEANAVFLTTYLRKRNCKPSDEYRIRNLLLTVSKIAEEVKWDGSYN